jgi:hydroxyacylglutathione hydrolase
LIDIGYRERAMPQEIIPLSNSIVNCYLLKNDDDYVLIDTGFSLQRRSVKSGLIRAGCQPGNLRVIIITHGDSDHCGNALHLRNIYKSKIGAHRDESAAIEKGDMRLNRKRLRENSSFLSGVILGLPVARLGKANRFKPDIYFEDGHDLSEYGCNGKILHIPGHSRGSIGVITPSGELFCGDLLKNNGKPGRNSLVDDPAEMEASIERLKSLGVRIVYPGHGKPFTMEEL